MFAKALVFAFLMAGSPLTISTADAAPPAARQARQHKRIVKGARSGQLTRKETKQLRRQQRHIQRTKKRMKRDGVITKRERRILKRKQNRASRNIHRKRHNARRR